VLFDKCVHPVWTVVCKSGVKYARSIKIIFDKQTDIQSTQKHIPVVEETKFLLKHLKEKYTKALNVLHVIAHTTWGADQQTLLYLCRSLIRS